MGSLLIKRIVLLTLFLSCNNIWLIANDKQNQTTPLYKDKGSEELQNFKNIIWSTYFGETGNDYINQIAMDKVGNFIIGGYVNSNNLPVDINSYQKQNKGGNDFYIAKFSSDFKLIWSTYIGGAKDDYLIALGIDIDDNIWISGEVNSSDFPSTSNAVSRTHSGGTKDIIICKFSSDGNLEYSTYLGGRDYESALTIAFDNERNVYFGGRSWSNNFPTTVGAYQKNKFGYYDGILVKFNIDSYKYYGTYVGITNNSGTDNLYIEALTIDNQNNIIIGGHTNSSKLTMVNSKLGDKFKGIYDAYLIKFDNSMNIIWSNYYGGSKNDRLSKIDCDENGNIYGIGFTKSIDLEMKNSFDSVHQSFEDAFLFKINSSGELQWSTYLGGNRTEGNQMDDDNIDRIYADIKYFNNKIGIVFKTNSSDLPLIGNNYYSKDYLGGQYDVYSMILSDNGIPIQSSYLGGDNLDIAFSSIFTKDYIFICGNTNSTNIKTTTNAFQSNYKSGIDGFVMKFMINKIIPITSNNPICEGDDLLLLCDSVPDAEYFWSGPNGFSSNLRKTIIKNAKINHSGIYSLYLKIEGQYSDTSYIDVIVSKYLVSPGDSSLIYLGSAERTEDYLKLTNAEIFDTGAIWLRKKFSFKKDFVTTFEFRVTGGSNGIVKESSIPGADGFAFVIQNHDYPYLGQKGGDMGYTGIPNSLAVEYDMFQNPYDLNGNHIAVQSMGSEPNIANHLITKSMLGRNDNIPIIQQNTIYYSKIEYSWESKTLSIYLGTDSVLQSPVLSVNNFDMTTFLNLEDNEYAYIGFTSGTGNAYQEHQIINWVVPCTNPPVIIDNVGDNFVNSKQMLVYPNPGRDLIEIELDLPLYEKVSLSLTDITGKVLITILDNQHLLYGKLKLPVNTGDLGSGMYFLRLQTLSDIEIQKVLIIK
ncbi:MAG: SBBP repeat-containing protein [Candidatus Kapabacteria bacterium]|nr:SBBP repeat-containing protein [Candidatus Kapabacteria bacterium]